MKTLESIVIFFYQILYRDTKENIYSDNQNENTIVKLDKTKTKPSVHC